MAIATDALKRVLPPEKMPESERMKLENTFKLALMETNIAAFEKQIEDTMNARSLAKRELDKGNAFTNVLAAIHRPTWSLVMLALFVWSVISPHFGFPKIELTSIHQNIMMSVIFFYFGGRSVEKVFKSKS